MALAWVVMLEHQTFADDTQSLPQHSRDYYAVRDPMYSASCVVSSSSLFDIAQRVSETGISWWAVMQVCFFFAGHGCEQSGKAELCSVQGGNIQVEPDLIKPLCKAAEDLVIMILLDCCRYEPGHDTYYPKTLTEADMLEDQTPLVWFQPVLELCKPIAVHLDATLMFGFTQTELLCCVSLQSTSVHSNAFHSKLAH